MVTHGTHYVKRIEKAGSFTIIKRRLSNWWNVPAVWTICFAMLFGKDVATVDFDRDFDLFNLTETFGPLSDLKVVHPEILAVMAELLNSGLRVIIKNHEIPDSASDLLEKNASKTQTSSRSRSRSNSLLNDNASQGVPPAFFFSFFSS
jgi:beige protein homolog 1